MRQRYAKELSFGSNNSVVALREEEAAKMFSKDTRSNIGS